MAHDPLKVRAVVSHREIAPGAGEFTPPVCTGCGCRRSGRFRKSRAGRSGLSASTTVEVAAEREWSGVLVIGVRAFRQDVEDQVVTMFGLGAPGFRARRRALSRRVGWRFLGAGLGCQRQPGGVGRHSRVR